MVGHRTATKCWSKTATVGPCQTRAWLSTASIPSGGRIFALNSRFRYSTRKHTAPGGEPAVNGHAFGVLRNVVRSRSSFISLAMRSNASSQLISAIYQNLAHGIPETSDGFRSDEIHQASAFRTKCTAVDRVIGSPSIWKIDALAFFAPSPRRTSTAHSLRNNRCRYYGFRGAQQFILPGFRERYAGGKTQCAAVVPAIPPAQILKNCLLLTAWIAPCFDIVTSHLHSLAAVQGVGVIFLCGRGRKGPELANFPPSRKGL